MFVIKLTNINLFRHYNGLYMLCMKNVIFVFLSLFKGATNLHFTHFSFFYNTGLSWSAFSTYYFGRLGFHLSMFDVFSACPEI